ncbi:MAG: DODA-type extradiol aromatic ring-opening family dioxygenase [Candidatus Limnocylindrales bacterium]
MTGIVFACIAPHGSLAIREASAPADAALATATQAAMAELGQRLEAAAPDVVVLVTPHGIHVQEHLAVVIAGTVAGALDDAPAISLELQVDRELAAAVLRHLRAAGVPALGVSFGGNDARGATFPLDWGSLIPLWFLGGRMRPPVPVVLIAPARDLPAETHVTAGAAIARAVASLGRRAAFVASADQAHAHSADGPYGFDPAARVHDELIVGLLREGRLAAACDLDPSLIATALPDSWWQHLVLLGAIGERWRPRVLAYEAPTYYGMLVAAFDPPAS